MQVSARASPKKTLLEEFTEKVTTSKFQRICKKSFIRTSIYAHTWFKSVAQ